MIVTLDYENAEVSFEEALSCLQNVELLYHRNPLCDKAGDVSHFLVLKILGIF